MEYQDGTIINSIETMNENNILIIIDFFSLKIYDISKDSIILLEAKQ
jgi:hypothetical protein